jgi:hypothetical protein
MTLQGKGWFIWQVPKCEGGVPAAIADVAAAAGCTHVLIKVAERTFGFGFDKMGRDLVPPVAEALRARGIQVWGWHYVYGDNPAGEANAAVQRCKQLKLDGYVIDAEKEYKQPGKAAAARTFMAALRAGLPNTLIALSSYRYPALHPELPWRVFLEKCDLNMPQVYWEQAHNPDQQLARCLTEFSRTALVGFVRPVVPTGAAYGVPNPAWRATPADIAKFYGKALELGLAGANLYVWDYARSPGNTDLWDAAKNINWPAPQPQDIVSRFIDALNTGKPAQVLALYQDNVGHVTGQRTVVGLTDLGKWYTDLLTARLPGAQFNLLDSTGSGSYRRFRWTASGPGGRIVDGDDTLGLRDGLIQYHYTFFNITPSA